METAAQDSFARLLSIIRRLRSPGGCAWDREQSPTTLRSGLVEEAWEAVSAIDTGDEANLREELCDLYLLVTMIAWMHEERSSFTVADVLEGIAGKLVRRHPHVFGDAKPGSVPGILAQWDRIKRDERGNDVPPSALDGIPGSLPPLERSAALQKRAAKVGFDWPAADPVWDKLAEETRELREAAASGDARRVEEELGDLLFTVVNLARFLKADPALALNRTNGKFARRFRAIEQRLAARGITPAEAGLEAMDEVWNQLRDEERNASK
ncbi:MAG: nucleoside triphosphate pyrophosphohydrolase [Spirochaetes bacterium]|nr:nucleoside triphosphate pyrophosphohydrolase [Spirochaetota bacterium]